MTHKDIPPGKDPRAHVMKLTAVYREEAGQRIVGVMEEMMRRINADPKLPPPDLDMIARLQIAQESAAGLFAFAMSLIEATSRGDGSALSTVATAFCQGFNTQYATLVHIHGTRLRLRLSVTVTDPPPTEEPNRAGNRLQ